MTTQIEALDNLTELEETRRGHLIAETLGLRHKKHEPTLYNTQWGTKTDLGLFRVCKRLVLDGE